MEESTQQTATLQPRPELPENLITAMRTVVDPEIGLDVIALGLIRAVRDGETEAEVDMMLTTPFCPYGGWMIQQVKTAAEGVLNKPTKVTVIPDLWDFNYMEDPGLLSGW